MDQGKEAPSPTLMLNVVIMQSTLEPAVAHSDHQQKDFLTVDLLVEFAKMTKAASKPFDNYQPHRHGKSFRGCE
jgi:hypothetical protein